MGLELDRICKDEKRARGPPQITSLHLGLATSGLLINFFTSLKNFSMSCLTFAPPPRAVNAYFQQQVQKK